MWSLVIKIIMSRVGKKPIKILNGVEVKISAQSSGDTNSVKQTELDVKGPKGSLHSIMPRGVKVEQKEDQLVFVIDNPKDNAIWGLSRALVNNMIVGVTEGFSKTLEINGVGFKVESKGNKVVLNVGFSHPVEYAVPEGIKVEVDKNQIKISGIDKQLIGQTAAEIRNIKKPEPYKGKGIKYIDETIRRKAGKVVKSE